ncbi:MAG: ComF family protein [Candidatus Nealsonbacteria bacterium]|nr:ComF family protein [Candidatus Nealsonbacteria bacterium]
MANRLKWFFADLFFPETCLNCGREGSYLCPDCEALLEISTWHQNYATQNLADLYFPLSSKNPLCQKIIRQFKSEPFIKDLAEVLHSLIIKHFQMLDNRPDFRDFVLVPIPLARKKLKWRGFNQAEEIAKKLAESWDMEIAANIFSKTKDTPPQAELDKKQKKENVKGAFSVEKPDAAQNRKILLVDDIYGSGATMEEAARTLKDSGAREIIGIVIARD